MAESTCVVDTNVALDLWLFQQPSVGALQTALANGSIRALASSDMRSELEHVLQRGGLPARWLARRSVREVLAAWDCHVTLTDLGVPPSMPRPQCTDADDQKFIDLALTAKVNWLFTRDRAVLKLARRLRPFGVRVAVPEMWLVALNVESEGIYKDE